MDLIDNPNFDPSDDPGVLRSGWQHSTGYSIPIQNPDLDYGDLEPFFNEDTDDVRIDLDPDSNVEETAPPNQTFYMQQNIEGLTAGQMYLLSFGLTFSAQPGGETDHVRVFRGGEVWSMTQNQAPYYDRVAIPVSTPTTSTQSCFICK